MKQNSNPTMTELNSRTQVIRDLGKRRTFLSVDSPIRLFIIVTVTLFLVEFFLMAVLFSQAFKQNLLIILLDPTLMVVIAFPVLHRFFFLPMRRLLDQKTRAELSLSNMNEILELRVQERTHELGMLNTHLQAEIQENRNLQEELETRVEQRTSELMAEIQDRLEVEHELEKMNKVLMASSVSERELRKVAEGLMEAAMALNSSQKVEEVLGRILDETQRVFPATVITLMLLENGRTVHSGWRGLDQMENASGMPPNIKMKDYPILERITASKAPVLVADTSLEPEWRHVKGLEWIMSFAAAPLGLEGNVIGHLQIMSKQPNHLTERSLQILNGFAAHAGLAIQNARLIENLQQSLTKERETREELIGAEKLASMGRAVASVAHELNNPIQTIKNCTFLLRNSLKSTDFEDGSKEMLDLISAETQRISALVSQLREFFRPSLNPTMVRVNLKVLLQEVNNSLKPQMRAAKVVSKIEQQDAPMVIFGVHDLMRQVFINLFQNAIDAMHDGGRLEVRFSYTQDASGLNIAVIDTGPGIPEDVQPKIFEPFFSTKPKGMGLGLAIVRQIIVRHNGSIRIESAPGKGTSFLISLPLYMGPFGEN